MESMSNAMVERLQEQIKVSAEKIKSLKIAINTIYETEGEEAPYTDIETESFIGGRAIRKDQFFGRSVNGAAKDFLRMQRRACTAKEILEGILKGGFEPPDQWGKENQWLRSLAIYLAKNTNDFVYVKNSDAYGLREFYPEYEKKRAQAKASKAESESAESEAVGGDSEETPKRKRRSKAEMEAAKAEEIAPEPPVTNGQPE